MQRCCVNPCCAWSGNHVDLKCHIESCHRDCIERWTFEGPNQIYIYFHFEKTFKVCFTERNNLKIYTAIYIGPPCEANDFILHIDFEDTSNKGYRLFAATPCNPCDLKQDIFCGDKISIGSHMLGQFSGGGKYHSKIYILNRRQAELKPFIDSAHKDSIDRWRVNGCAQIYVCYYNEETFNVAFTQQGELGVYAAMYMGPSCSASNYILNVEYEDQTGRGYKLYGAAPCVPSGSIENVFKGDRISFGEEMMSKFICGPKYASKISISRRC